MSSFATYLIGYTIFVIGLALAAFYLGVQPIWIAIGFIILIGLGILMATRSERPKDPPNV